MLTFSGYIPKRRGLIEHLYDGRLTPMDYVVLDLLLLWADAGTGIATTNGPGLVYLSGNQLKLDTVQTSLRNLEQGGYIKRPFYVQGQRGNHKIFIDKFVCTQGKLKLKTLSFASTIDWEHPAYEDLSEDPGENPSVNPGVSHCVNQPSNNNRNEKNENGKECMSEWMGNGTEIAFDQTDKTRVPASEAVAPLLPAQPHQQIAGRLAQRFFFLLDHPKSFSNSAAEWTCKFGLLVRESQLTEQDFVDFLDFALKENDYSVQYLNVAKDPMTSLCKNFDNLLRRWRARRKADAAAANATRKQAAAKAADNRPEYKKDTAQFL